ncbi:MAG: glycosyltransferase [Bacteroidota bacterium]|nr:glycosyltransferase [Bacteroidota bacterium]
MDRLPLSVCIIARNEERHLSECLGSVASIARQIVVVDTGSTDNTIAIARQFGAEVHLWTWNDDFSAARNESLRHAVQPWILVLDADELLRTPAAVAHALANASDNVGGFYVTLESMSKVGSSSPAHYVTLVVRLFRNDERCRYEGIIHEQILPSLLRAGYQCHSSAIVIEHRGYDLDPEQLRHKQLRNRRLLDRAVEQEPENPFYRLHRAKTLIALGDYTQARTDLIAALRTASPEGNLLPQILNHAALIEALEGNLVAARTYAERSLAVLPNQPMSWFLLGHVHRQMGNARAAFAAYTSALEAGDNPDPRVYATGKLLIPRDELEIERGQCAAAIGDHATAEQCYRTALHYNPANSRAQHLLEKLMAQKNGSLRPLLGLAMIVRNEETTLPRCLESVRSVVDQIIVVDTGSTDRTVDIAKQFGATVYHFEWCDDFAAARNEALRHITTEWVLYLDADETLPPASAAQIRPLLERQPPQVGGLLCTIISPHRVGEGGSEIHRGAYPRLFRNYGYPRIAFRGRIHEQITPSIIECGGAIVPSPIEIHHSGYDIPRAQLEEKVRRNYRLLIQHVQEEPLNAYAWFQLGQTLARMQLFAEAEGAFSLALRIGLSTPLHASAANALAYICGAQRRFEEAINWADESLRVAPHQALALIYKAHALYALERYEESSQVFAQALAHLDSTRTPLSVGFEVEFNRADIEAKYRDALARATAQTMNSA